MNSMKVGLLGLGVVGGGTWSVLARNAEEIARRAGRRIEVTRIAVRDVEKARARLGTQIPVSTDVHALVRDPDIDIAVELIGGDTLALELVREAIANGKHVVTANKALLAKYGNEIFAAASARGVMVAFESAVAGGIQCTGTTSKQAERRQNSNQIAFHSHHLLPPNTQDSGAEDQGEA